MQPEHIKSIWTIGHSTRSAEEFLALLNSFHISLLADIRRYPGSRRYPHFNKETLEASIVKAGIQYIHLEQLGGRRTPRKDSVNTAWRNAAFKGYADYMETAEFIKAAGMLEDVASRQKTAIMCSEAVWWRCHRSLVSDFLKMRGWTVIHITGLGKSTEHPYTSPARLVQGRLLYDGEQ